MLNKLFCFLLGLFLSINNSTAQKQVQRKPNIVYILADDLGYGDIGCYGQEKIETPHIDALARNGKKFTQHYAFAVCAPSRYLLMTGINSGSAYIRGNHEWGERGPVWDFKAMEENPFLEGQFPIPDSTLTLAEVLKTAGYTTGMVGKWGLGSPFSTGHPNRQGFDYFYGYICQRQDHTYYNEHLWENENRVAIDNKIVDPDVRFPDSLDQLDPRNYEVYQQKYYAPDYLVKAALSFIDKNKSKPFFLYYPTPLPHVSLQAPQRLVNYYHQKFGDEKPFLGGSYFPCRYPRATYAAMISLLDEQVGQIVAQLKKNGLYENTIIMFCSDNGPASNAGVDPVFFNSTGPFKGNAGWGKGYLREGGIRAPIIVQWPGKIKAGSSSSLVSATIDMMPTFCELLQVKIPAGVHGVSMLPEILGNEKQQKQHDYLYFEYPEYGGQQAVGMGHWKAVRMNLMKGNIVTELYDLSTDIKEQKNIAQQHPDIVSKMEAIMKKEHQTPEVSRFLIPVLER
ncbi:arylsulfatase [Niabella sp. CJ426]|uniref:arylsulfatase n=1 Tax=Niabella sp. CJ426 TaxID=3393740 RepID=UPI003D071897